MKEKEQSKVTNLVVEKLPRPVELPFVRERAGVRGHVIASDRRERRNRNIGEIRQLCDYDGTFVPRNDKTFTRHCEERSDEAIHSIDCRVGLRCACPPRNDEYRDGNPPTLILPLTTVNSTGGRGQLNSNHFTHFTHLTHFTHFKKAAFTLAEVLVTLAVIGIVAAMTIPTILNKYQEHIMVQKYKKVYSLLNNAVLQQYANNGDYYNCYYYVSSASSGPLADCKAMYEDMKKVLKTSKICDNNAYKNGCIPNYKGIDTLQHEQNFKPDDPDFYLKNCPGFSDNEMKNTDSAWVLSDGTIIVFYRNSFFRLIMVDLNGMQGPNKWGHDMFTFDLIETKNGVLKYKRGGCMLPEDGGISSHDMFDKAGLK